MKAILFVLAGGAVGAVLRYLITENIPKSYFPWGTFFINILGCFLIGILYALLEHGVVLTPAVRLFLMTGFCGGFTTFSAFALENINLIQHQQFFLFCMYAVSTFGFTLAALVLGMYVAKWVLYLF